MDETTLRENLVDLLTKEQAHVGARAAFADVPPGQRTRRAPGGGHSVWELLEHLRIAQEDIIRYTLDAHWTSPAWPSGYWPADTAAPDDEHWNASLAAFFDGLEEAVAMARDRTLDLTARIPHGEDRTYLRQLLLIADHNAYHVAQVVETRRVLGDWPPAAKKKRGGKRR